MISGIGREIAGLRAIALLLSAPESPPGLLFARFGTGKDYSILIVRPPDPLLPIQRGSGFVLANTLDIRIKRRLSASHERPD
jgi:hypothetical protein